MAVAKSGSSTWTITGTSNYTGATSVTGGVLNIAGVGDLQRSLVGDLVGRRHLLAGGKLDVRLVNVVWPNDALTAHGKVRGLLNYRHVSDKLGSTPWYLRLLRDEGLVAQRLMQLLGTSALVPDLLVRAPEVLRLAISQMIPETKRFWRKRIENSESS